MTSNLDTGHSGALIILKLSDLSAVWDNTRIEGARLSPLLEQQLPHLYFLMLTLTLNQPSIILCL